MGFQAFQRRGFGRWLLALTMSSAIAVAQPADAPPEEEPGDRGEGAVPRGGSGAVVKRPPTAKKARQIKPPRLLEFKAAKYPSGAEAAGVQGNVLLELTIDKDGGVIKSEVVEPAGHGFDEAARAASLDFRFDPATMDGKPIVAKIRYRYAFTLQEVEAPPPPPPSTGELAGRLRILSGDAPLAGAEVVITAPDGATRVVRSEADGSWRLPDLPPGKYRVRVAAEGFAPVDIGEEVVAGEATELVYRLAPEATGLEVLIEAERPPREVTRRTLQRRELARIPGTGGDALRALQSLPGVARPPGIFGLLIVRGSAPEDTETFIDGASVPLIFHFGGLTSVVPTELLDRIDFYPGNFSAKYGRVMGGIVDVGLKSPNTRCNADYMKPTDETGCFHGLLQVDLIDTRILVQGPLGPKDWTFAAGGRRSWIDVWLKPALEEAGATVTSAPVYYDYQLIADKRTDDGRLSVRFYGSDDEFKIIVNDPFSQDPGFGGNISLGTSFFRGQVVSETTLSEDLELYTMFSVGRDKVGLSLGTFVFEIDATPINPRSEFRWKASEGVKINAGLDFLLVPFNVLVRLPPPPRPGEASPGPFTTRPTLEQDEGGVAFRPAWYVEGEVTPTRRLRLVPGARLDYARDSSHGDFSPRFNARYDVIAPWDAEDETKPRKRTTVKGGVGVFHQPPQFQETDEVFGTPNIKSNRAIHYSVGVEQEITRQIELGVEGFYKDLNQLVSREAEDSGFAYDNRGTGHVVGLESLLKYKPDNRFFGWIAYTLSRSVRKDFADDDPYLFQYDQTHNLTALGSYRLGRGWEFGARFRIISGPLVTPVLPGLASLYAAEAAAYTPLSGEPFSERLDTFHSLDIRVDKRWQFKAWRLSAFLDLQNVYNNPAQEAVLYNYNFTQQTVQGGLPLIPSIGMRGEF